MPEYSPIYTDAETVDQYLGDEEGTCTAEEIRQAELDTDHAMISVNSYQQETGLKIDPNDLSNRQQDLLARAVAEQIRYRRIQGPEFFNIREYKEASGDGFSRKGRRPKYSDAAKDYLRRAGFTRTRRIGSDRGLTAQEIRDLYFEQL